MGGSFHAPSLAATSARGFLGRSASRRLICFFVSGQTPKRSTCTSTRSICITKSMQAGTALLGAITATLALTATRFASLLETHVSVHGWQKFRHLHRANWMWRQSTARAKSGRTRQQISVGGVVVAGGFVEQQQMAASPALPKARQDER